MFPIFTQCTLDIVCGESVKILLESSERICLRYHHGHQSQRHEKWESVHTVDVEVVNCHICDNCNFCMSKFHMVNVAIECDSFVSKMPHLKKISE
jgi:hypothetical protein